MARRRHIPGSRIHRPTASGRVSRDRVLPFASRATTNASWRICLRNCRSGDFRMTTRAPCCRRSSQTGSTSACPRSNRLVAETRGNPLRWVELPRGRSTGERWPAASRCRARGSAEPDRGTTSDGATAPHCLLRRPAAKLMSLAAADPAEDAARSLAPRQLGVEPPGCARGEPAAGEQLPAGGRRAGSVFAIRWSDRLHRSLASHDGPTRGSRRALRDATDPATDPDRRAWHRAHAAIAPDEEVAGELIDSASESRAQEAGAARRRRRRVPGTSGDVHARPW